MEEKLKSRIRGIIIPLPTPCLQSGELDLPMLEQLIDFYLGVGVHALFPLGSFGQGPACSPEQRKKVAEVVLKRVGDRVPVIVHVGAVDPFTSIELGRHAREHGAHAIGLVGPYYYNDRSEAEILEHFAMVDREVNLPLFVYNNAAYSGYNIAPPLMQKLVERVPNIFGMKLAKGTIREAQGYLKVLPDLSLMAPPENLFPGLLVALKGSIAVVLVGYPELGLDVIRAVEKEDFHGATLAQLRIFQYMELGISPQESIRLRGFNIKGSRRAPGRSMSPEARLKLREKLEAFGLPVA